MLERVITAGVGVVGLAVIGLGVASATAWRADDVLVATASASTPVVVTEPGVLELGGDPVTVRATTTGGSPVVLAVGRDTDVTAWVGADEHQTVTGLSGWHDLALSAPTTGPAGDGAPAPAASGSPSASPSPSASGQAADEGAVADPTDSDLWVAQVSGNGSAELEWPAQSGRWTLLAVAPDGGTPTLSMAWPRTVTTPWLWPCVAVGALLVLASVWWMVRAARRDRRAVRWESVSTGALPQVPAASGAPLTRRQMREAEAAARARPRTGAIPRVRAAAQPVGAGTPGPATTAASSGAVSPAAPAAPPGADRPEAGATPSPEPTRVPAAAAGTAAPATSWGSSIGEGSRPAAPTAAPGWTPTPAASNPVASNPSSPSSPPDRGDASAVPVGQSRPMPVGSAAPTVALPAAGAAGAAQGASGAGASSVPGPSSVVGATATPALPATVGRPAWLARAPHHEAADAPARAGREEPTAPLAPVSADGPADGGHRPAWLPTSAGSHEAPATPEAPGGSRADAWRRAWGLPPLPTVPDGDRTDDEEAGR